MGNADLIPIAVVRETLKSKRLESGPDVIQRLVSDGFVRPSQRIPGSREYGLALSDVERLIYVLERKRSLRRRPTSARLALELARDGDTDVPVALVRQEIRHQVHAFYAEIRRSLLRACGLPTDPRRVDDESLAKAEAMFVRKVIKRKKPSPQRRVLEQRARVIARVLLGFLYERPVPDSQARLIPEMVRDNVMMDTTDRGHLGMGQADFTYNVTLATRTLQDMAPSFRLDDSKNSFYQAIDEASNDDLLRCVRVNRRASTALMNGLTKVASASKPYLDWFPNMLKTVHEPLACTIVGAMLASPDKEHVNSICEGLEQGRSTEIDSIADQLSATISVLLKVGEVRRARAAASGKP